MSHQLTCVRCRGPAGSNRLVLERPSGTTLGGLCRRCERRTFGDSLERGLFSLSGCGYCSGPARVVLPRCVAVVGADREGALDGRSVGDHSEPTLQLCLEHYRGILACAAGPPDPSRR